MAQSGNETEAAAESRLFQVMLPEGGAQRVLPNSVPAEITQTLEKVTAAGGGKFRQGETEVLLWGGGKYKKANAAAIVNGFTGVVKNAGWKYAVEGEENGITVFTALKESPRRAVVGLYGATDEALILAAMEILPNNGNGTVNTQNNDNEVATTSDDNQNDASATVPSKPIKNSSGSSISGEWSTGYVSTLTPHTPVIGPPLITPGKSRTWTYKFYPNGTYEFAGLMQITVGGCQSTYFQDKRGNYTINGNQLTLSMAKNLWRSTNGCSASGNKEAEGNHTPENYTFSVKRSESGKEELCLNSGEDKSGSTHGCFERKVKYPQNKLENKGESEAARLLLTKTKAFKKRRNFFVAFFDTF
jgi:hypothetical protein